MEWGRCHLIWEVPLTSGTLFRSYIVRCSSNLGLRALFTKMGRSEGMVSLFLEGSASPQATEQQALMLIVYETAGGVCRILERAAQTQGVAALTREGSNKEARYMYP